MKVKSVVVVLTVNVFMMLSVNAQLNKVSYSDSKQKLNGLSGVPKSNSKTKSGVLILPAWMGIDDHARDVAKQLTGLGYYSFVADIYGDGSYPKNQSEAGERAGFYKNNAYEYVKRIQLALDQLVKSGADASKIVVIGYCFGGTGALNAARENLNVKGVVSFHGGLGKDVSRTVHPIKPKVLVCHGANDSFVPDEQIKQFQNEMKQANADWQMIYYADAVHAFTDPTAGSDPSKGVAYNEKADKRSWKLMVQFLDEVFNE